MRKKNKKETKNEKGDGEQQTFRTLKKSFQITASSRPSFSLLAVPVLTTHGNTPLAIGGPPMATG